MMTSDEIIGRVLAHQWQDAVVVALLLIIAAVALYARIRLARMRKGRRYRERF